MSEEREIEEQEEISDLDYVDGKMKMLGISLNLLDPEGTFKSVPSEEVLIEIMRAVRDDYRQLSDAILALREEDTEPTSTHDGKLDEDGSFTVYHGDVWSSVHDDAIQGIHVLHRNSSYGHVTFTPQQALSLLAWLTQEKPALEQLTKEQS